MRFPFLLVVGTIVVLVAAATDAVVWTQGSERRALQREIHDTHVEAELLRLENERLRRELFHQKVVNSEQKLMATEPCADEVVPVVVECPANDPLCGL